MSGYASATLDAYRETNCTPLRLASWIAARVPRGKGAVPRALGRLLKPWIHHSIRTRRGALLPVVPEALDVFTSMSRQGGSWDDWVFRAIDAAAAPGAVVYDIGANVGFITVELAYKRRADSVRVVSFEPRPELAANIRLAGELNALDNVRVMELAVGATDGTIPFYCTSHSVHSTALQPHEGARRVHVRQAAIDTLVESGEIPPPSCIKIDIEGYELEALKGAVRTIRRFRPWILFEYSWGTIWGGTKAEEYEAFFSSLDGYELCSLSGHRLGPEVWSLRVGAHRDVVARPSSVGGPATRESRTPAGNVDA